MISIAGAIFGLLLVLVKAWWTIRNERVRARMIRFGRLRTCRGQRRAAMPLRCRRNMPSGDAAARSEWLREIGLPFCLVLIALAVLAMCGCASTRPTTSPNQVIAVPGETVPHPIRNGETSNYYGWVVPTPLMNELAPCFRDRLEHPPIDEKAGMASRPAKIAARRIDR
jgi:hypothetical protein